MPLPHLFGLVFGGAAVVLDLALLLVVLTQAPRRRDSQLMALYLFSLVVVGGASAASRMAALLGHDPEPLIALALIATGGSRLALFWFVTAYAGIQRHAWVRITRGIGVAAFAAGLWTFGTGALVDAVYTPDGLLQGRLSPLAIALTPVALGVTAASLVCIWVYRRRGTAPLLLGAAIMAVGFFVPVPFFISGDSQPPVAVALMAVGSLFFTYPILRASLFAPLQRSEASLAALIETSVEPVWSVDANLHLTAFNKAAVDMAKRLFGMTPLVGSHALQGLSPQEQLLWQRFYERALRGERLSVVRHLTTPGLPADIEVTFTPIGNRAGAAVVMRDVSDHRRVLGEHVRAREAAERDAQAKTRLLVELGDALAARLGDDTDRGLRAMVAGVRELADVETGKLALDEQPFALRASLAAIAKAQPGDVVIDVAPEVPDAVASDVRRLEQILVILTAGGPARVRAERDAEMFEAVLVRFDVRAPGAVMRDAVSTMIAARLVEAMGGRLAVEAAQDGRALASFSVRLATRPAGA